MWNVLTYAIISIGYNAEITKERIKTYIGTIIPINDIYIVNYTIENYFCRSILWIIIRKVIMFIIHISLNIECFRNTSEYRNFVLIFTPFIILNFFLALYNFHYWLTKHQLLYRSKEHVINDIFYLSLLCNHLSLHILHYQ